MDAGGWKETLWYQRRNESKVSCRVATTQKPIKSHTEKIYIAQYCRIVHKNNINPRINHCVFPGLQQKRSSNKEFLFFPSAVNYLCTVYPQLRLTILSPLKVKIVSGKLLPLHCYFLEPNKDSKLSLQVMERVLN